MDTNKEHPVKTWNYRVMVDADGNYNIREVYYNEDKAIEGWTDECSPYGEELDELISDLNYMMKALTQDVLVESDLIDDKIEEIKNDINSEQEARESEDEQE
jgi:hypothetical protein